jgi:hypothetical protein
MTPIQERILDLRDSLVLTREQLARAVDAEASHQALTKLRAEVVALLEKIEQLNRIERPRA